MATRKGRSKPVARPSAPTPPSAPQGAPEGTSEQLETLVPRDPPLAVVARASTPTVDLIDRLGGRYKDSEQGPPPSPESTEFYFDELITRVAALGGLLDRKSNSTTKLRSLAQIGLTCSRLREHFQAELLEGR